MFRNDHCYDLIADLNYNTKLTKKFRGSAIFLHCTEKKNKYTDGCIAINKLEFIEILKTLPKSCKIIIR